MYEAETFPVRYVLGVSADDGRAAVQFTVEARSGSWGAVGLRASAGTTGSMQGLDIIGVDACDRPPTVTDCVPMTSQVGMPAVSPSTYQRTVLAESRGGVRYTFWRYLEPDGTQDVALEVGVEMDLAYATGPGVFGKYAHTARAVRRFELKPCSGMPDLFPPTADPATAVPGIVGPAPSRAPDVDVSGGSNPTTSASIAADMTSTAGVTMAVDESSVATASAPMDPPEAQAPTPEPAAKVSMLPTSGPAATASPPPSPHAPANIETLTSTDALWAVFLGLLLLVCGLMLALFWTVRRRKQLAADKAKAEGDAIEEWDGELMRTTTGSTVPPVMPSRVTRTQSVVLRDPAWTECPEWDSPVSSRSTHCAATLDAKLSHALHPLNSFTVSLESSRGRRVAPSMTQSLKHYSERGGSPRQADLTQSTRSLPPEILTSIRRGASPHGEAAWSSVRSRSVEPPLHVLHPLSSRRTRVQRVQQGAA